MHCIHLPLFLFFFIPLSSSFCAHMIQHRSSSLHSRSSKVGSTIFRNCFFKNCSIDWALLSHAASMVLFAWLNPSLGRYSSVQTRYGDENDEVKCILHILKAMNETPTNTHPIAILFPVLTDCLWSLYRHRRLLVCILSIATLIPRQSYCANRSQNVFYTLCIFGVRHSQISAY